MKPMDLAKLKGKKIEGQQRQAATPDRFGKDAHALLDKREQRERDRELGLVAFACKLHGDLVKQIHALATSRKTGVNEITAELITKGLAKK
jgi:hypothetical protein